jgi:type IV pilus assembly protein PilY1
VRTMKIWGECPIKIPGREGGQKLRGLSFAGLIFLLLTLIFPLTGPEVAWAGYCNTPNPSPASLTVYVGSDPALNPGLTLTAVPYENGANYDWTFSPGLPSWISVSYDNKKFTARLTVNDTSAVTEYVGTAYNTTSKCTGAAAQTTNITIRVDPAPTVVITPTTSSSGTEGIAYQRTMQVECNPSPCVAGTWSASGLPSGLAINATTGVISGTPASGSGGVSGANYTVTVTYSVAGTEVASVSFLLTIYPGIASLSITSTGLQPGVEGQSYTYTLTATGGEQPYSWTASGLPSGFEPMSDSPIPTIHADRLGTGTASGSPYSVTITLRDKNGSTTSKTFSLAISTAPVVSGGMSDYCATPPFVKKEIKPNVLLMIDNSASMYDLFSTDPATDAFVCYDQTYSSRNSYPGYFKRDSYYSYNFNTSTGDYFQETASFPASCTKRSVGASGGILCVDLSANPTMVTNFVASGNFLNWLTASKFDVEKKVLTGGKYDVVSGDLVAESRGCVGRKFIKEAIVGDYDETTTPTSLGITFAVKGPPSPFNATAPSSGGQTYVEIYSGDYLAGKCQNAVDVFTDESSGQLEQRQAAADCLAYDSHSSDYANKTKNAFIQTVQECWQYTDKGIAIGTDAANTVKNFCSDIYNNTICSGSNKPCESDGECDTAHGETCVQGGPSAISAGNPASLCSIAYAGVCYVGVAPPYTRAGFDFPSSPMVIGGNVYASGEDCIKAQHEQYCGKLGYPPVVDPTVAAGPNNTNPYSTEDYGNVPAILGDLGLQGQLDFPVGLLRVRIRTSPGTGVIDKFKDTIRFGVMNFQFAGSKGECTVDDAINPLPAGALICPKVCQTHTGLSCTMNQDCPSGESCVSSNTISEDLNEDGAKIRAYVGDPAGDHSYGIINSLDVIRADSWTPFAEGMYDAIAYFTQRTSASALPYRINDDDFDATINPIKSSCQANHVLIISDGMSTADQNSHVRTFVGTHNDGDGLTTTSLSGGVSEKPTYFGSWNLDELAYYAQHSNIFTGSDDINDIKFLKETIQTHVIYTGKQDTTNCSTDDDTKVRTCAATLAAADMTPEVQMEHAATEGGGIYKLASDEDTLYAALDDVFNTITKNSASGTAASVLASGEGSGANIIQAVFYPMRKFGDTNIRWTGRLTNLWYYVDPFFSSSAIYEDTNPDHQLRLNEDDVTSFYFDGTNTMAMRKADTNNDGVADTDITPDIQFEELSDLWEAGYQLWARTTARRIKTSLGSGIIDFTTGNAAMLKPYLRAADSTEASNIISYTRGDSDPAGFRPRTVTIGSDTHIWKLGDVIQSTPRIASGIKMNAYYDRYFDTSYYNYVNPAPPDDPAEPTPAGTSPYRDRGMVFAGANDGMLHAFKLGKLIQHTSSGFLKASLSLDPDPSVPLGSEVWAFIPKNVLPYLKFIGDPSYCHLYSVDMSPYIFDASIGTTDCTEADYSQCPKDDAAATATPKKRWRTIIIGGMRFGGACRISSGSCNSGNCSITSTTECSVDGDCPGGETCLPNCVKTPGVDINGNGSVDAGEEESLGLSTYFALDITDTLDNPSHDPQLLWEFSSNDLGFSSTGPSIVRINATADPGHTKNGRWFVVVGSGPTGPISSIDHQFLARSDQSLKLFIFDLKKGPGANNADVTVKNTGIANAFGGSMINETDDLELDYQDDVVYVPYTRKCTSTTLTCEAGTWTDGGVGRLVTHGSDNPAGWEFTKVIDGIGPVTSSAVRLYDTRKGKQWVYFGSGRYFFEQETPDDASGQRGIAGVRDLCFNADTNTFCDPCSSCTDFEELSGVGDLIDVTNVGNVPANPDSVTKGWYIKFATGCTKVDGTSTSCDDPDAYRAEREITDPLATTGGVVFFTSLKPKNRVCDPGGESYLWAAKYDTGGEPGALLKGKAILQVSTGAIKEVPMDEAFSTHPDRSPSVGDRVTSSMQGVPPVAQGLSILTSPPPVKRTMHIRER